MTGAELIAKERKRQIEDEKWSNEHDQAYTKNELVRVAVCYALPDDGINLITNPAGLAGSLTMSRTYFWPWDRKWWKPDPNSRIIELMKAGALIAAEIDRLQNSKP